MKENASRYGFDIPEIWIEPGRSLVGDAGTTLYTVGSQKEVPGVRQYILADTRHFFLRANRIKSCACVSHERTARFDPNFRDVKTVTGSIFFHSFDNLN